MKRASIALWLAIWGYVGYLIYDWANTPPKPVNTLTPEHQLKIWTEAHNKLNKRVHTLETEIDRMKRLKAGELPSIKGGVSYE